MQIMCTPKHNYTGRKTANRKDCSYFTYQTQKSMSLGSLEQNEQLITITRDVLCYLYCRTLCFFISNRNDTCCNLKENGKVYNLKLQLETMGKYSVVPKFDRNCGKTFPPTLYPLCTRSMRSKESCKLNRSY